MFSGLEIIFNLLWFSMLVVGAIITFVIMRKRDPIDDGPAIEEQMLMEDEVEAGAKHEVK